MKALIVGSSGTIGKAVTQLFNEKGHEVVQASRSTQPAINIEDPASIDDFYAATDGEFDAIICAAGSAAFTAVDAIKDEDVSLSLNSKLSGQVNLVRKGLSKLKPGGIFVITGGLLAYDPLPKTSLIAMVNAGLEGFAKGAAVDLAEGRRIVIVHPPWVAETAKAFGMDAAPWPNAARVAEAYLEAAENGKNGEPVFVEGYKPA